MLCGKASKLLISFYTMVYITATSSAINGTATLGKVETAAPSTLTVLDVAQRILQLLIEEKIFCGTKLASIISQILLLSELQRACVLHCLIHESCVSPLIFALNVTATQRFIGIGDIGHCCTVQLTLLGPTSSHVLHSSAIAVRNYR